jgi:membrane associated rhomboid family serine protease
LFPIRDENRSRTTPHVTRMLIIFNVIFFLPQLYYALVPMDPAVGWFVDSLYRDFMMVPADILQGRHLYTLITSLFLHADIFHIGGNLLFLYVFGDNVEDAMGPARYLLFYLIAGIVADIVHILSITSPLALYTPTLGASGAISGVLGAYIVMYPRARIQTLILAYFITIVRIPAVFFLGFWFLLQLLYTWLDVGGGVAYWAHIGGFVAGTLLILLFRQRRSSPGRGVFVSSSALDASWGGSGVFLGAMGFGKAFLGRSGSLC